jgi:phage anti-repressor protein
METENWQLSATIYSPQNYDIFLSKDVELLHNLSEMKKKSNDMSFDMFNDGVPPSPMPVFTNANDAVKNDPSEIISKVSDANGIQNELIQVDFDNKTVSARALHNFLASKERFHFWCKRYFSRGFVENVDFTAISFFITLNRNAKRDIGDFLLQFEMAKNIAIMQSSEKGIQVRNYFLHVENSFFNKKTDGELFKHLVDKTIVLETFPSHLDRKVNTKSDIRKRVIKKIIAEQRKKK